MACTKTYKNIQYKLLSDNIDSPQIDIGQHISQMQHKHTTNAASRKNAAKLTKWLT